EILATRFDRVWPDGTGVRMAGRRLGFAVPENVNGTDLFPLLAREKLSFWFLGGRPGVAQTALERCAAAFPNARFLGATDGYQHDWDAALEKISAAAPDVLLVALGVTLQEKWIAAHDSRLRHAAGCTIAVGGLLDFLSGRIPRAPRWMRRAGIEWLWRLAMEPRRMFRRYVIGNVLFLRRLPRRRLTA
ncbi:MAG: WecB/TagA/CpsF family glycosyltransferase, partial [Kiritimatiellae bacterium]|nr:WecB/TagA/CpsF family glycosyltransferase [Kiritimatiellia bacterium]